VKVRRLLAVAGVLVLTGTLGASARPSASAPSFARAKRYETGRAPVSVAIGDLNGDGKPDLAVANIRASTISVLLNRSDGTYEAKRDYPTGDGSPSSVAIGDLNGDGKEDLATANFFGSVSVLLNRGDGSFERSRAYLTQPDSSSVAIGDLNGDGKPDLATANEDANSVSVLLNKGDGTFQTKRDYTTGERPNSVAIGDLDSDGKPDLAITNYYSDSVSILANRGDGSFRAKRDYRTGRRPDSVAIGDLDSDGKPDLATSFSGGLTVSGSVSVLLNRGNGGFRAKRDYPARGANSVAIGDMNGDDTPDLVTANSRANAVSVLINTPGLCTVQVVRGQPLPTATRTIARANCRVGRIRRAYSRTVGRGRVISQRPRFGAVLPGGGEVNLVVSRGRRPS
jgi:hypothetical protein